VAELMIMRGKSKEHLWLCSTEALGINLVKSVCKSIPSEEGNIRASFGC